MADCPVDEQNLSFSDDDYNSLFITQSSFRDVKTQDVVEAVDFMDSLGEFSVGDNSNVEKCDIADVSNVEEFDWCEHEDVQYFDFSGDVDNGYDVSTQDQGYILKSHSDGSEIFVYDSTVHSDGNFTGDTLKLDVISDVESTMYDPGTIGSDLKHFGPAVSEQKLDQNKSKRWVKIFIKILVNFHICHRA